MGGGWLVVGGTRRRAVVQLGAQRVHDVVAVQPADGDQRLDAGPLDGVRMVGGARDLGNGEGDQTVQRVDVDAGRMGGGELLDDAVSENIVL